MRSVADVLELVEADSKCSVVLFLGNQLFNRGTLAPRNELTVFICLLYCFVEN
jgi:hypothetical protein